MIVAFLAQHFDSGTPELMSHHHLLLLVYISQQHLVKLLKPFTEGNRLRTGGTFTDSPPPEMLRGSSTWTGLCIMHFSLLFVIFKKCSNGKIRKKYFLWKCQLILNVMARHSCVNDPQYLHSYSTIEHVHTPKYFCLCLCSWNPWIPDIFSSPPINILLPFSSFMKRRNIFPSGHRARIG